MLRKGLLGALFALAAQLPAEAADKSVPPNPDQTVTFPGGGVLHRDLVYAAIDGFRPLTLDLYQAPAKPKDTPQPAILFVHGGDWVTGDARHLAGFDDFPATLAALAAKGYVIASVNYRLSSEAHFPAAVQDVKSAVRWLRGHAGDYNIDTTRVMAWGAEAGGQIAAMVGTSCGVNALEPAADAKSKATLASDCVQGVIDWYAPADLASWDTGGAHPSEPGASTHLGAYLGCEAADCAPGLVRAASPLSYISTLSPPFLIQHGSADTRVAPDQSQKLNNALRDQHVPSEVQVYPGAGQDFTKDGAPDPAANTKALADLEDFIVKTFPPAPASAKPAAISSAKSKAAKAARPRSSAKAHK
jgi:acetyl esterase/lipase